MISKFSKVIEGILGALIFILWFGYFFKSQGVKEITVFRLSSADMSDLFTKVQIRTFVWVSARLKQHKDCNFSYAGLKTQVKLAIESKNIDAGIPFSSASIEDQSLRADIAASFQRVAVLHLEEKCERAIQWALEIEPSIKHLVVSGGVASNQYVRARFHKALKTSAWEDMILHHLPLNPRTASLI